MASPQAVETIVVESLEVVNLRNIAHGRLTGLERVNFFVGPNGAGKTSLLEAIYYLGRGRSFRASHARRLIRSGCQSFRVVCTVSSTDGQKTTLGLERDGEQFTARVGGKPARTLADIAARLPVVLLDTHTHRLLDDGPGTRRRFVDWGVFQAEPAFLDTWQRFRLALRHRNAALRGGHGRAAIRAWDREIVPAAEEIDRLRRSYLEALESELVASEEPLVESTRLSLEYRRGWNSGETLAEVLANDEARDRALGYTAHGPHRADFAVKQDHQTVHERLSAGERKLLVAALVLAQATLYRRQTTRSCVLLIDDLPAELDAGNRARILRSLLTSPAQIFATVIARDELPGESRDEVKLFKLQAGRVEEMVY